MSFFEEVLSEVWSVAIVVESFSVFVVTFGKTPFGLSYVGLIAVWAGKTRLQMTRICQMVFFCLWAGCLRCWFGKLFLFCVWMHWWCMVFLCQCTWRWPICVWRFVLVVLVSCCGIGGVYMSQTLGTPEQNSPHAFRFKPWSLTIPNCY